MPPSLIAPLPGDVLSMLIAEYHLQAALTALAVAATAWLVLRPFFARSPLDNLPGPDRLSFLTGKHEG